MTGPFVCPRHGEYSFNARAHFTEMATCPGCIADGKAISRPWKEAWGTFDRWQSAGVPARFRNRRFENFHTATEEQGRALRAAKALATGDMQALALIGAVGTGKSHLSVGIVAEAVRGGAKCLWASVPDLLRTWKGTFAKGSELTEEKLLERIDAADLLVLDEIGLGNRSEWELSALFALVDQRYREGGRLVLTGNVADLATGIGERSADRVEEMGTVLALTGQSLRSKAADDPALQIEDDFKRPVERIEWPVCEAGRDVIEERVRR